MNYSNKYSLTKQENIFLIKKHLSSLVYTALILENNNITFPQTQIILQGFNDSSLSIDDIYTIFHLKKAFNICLNKLSYPLTIDLIKTFNIHIAETEEIESNVIYHNKVCMTKTDCTLSISTEDEVDNEIKTIINSDKTDTEKGVDLFLNIIYKQYFNNGNKQTALLSAIFYMCKNGCGTLEIIEKYKDTFLFLLNDMFKRGDKNKIKNFLYENCIFGIERMSVKDNEK